MRSRVKRIKRVKKTNIQKMDEIYTIANTISTIITYYNKSRNDVFKDASKIILSKKILEDLNTEFEKLKQIPEENAGPIYVMFMIVFNIRKASTSTNYADFYVPLEVFQLMKSKINPDTVIEGSITKLAWSEIEKMFIF